MGCLCSKCQYDTVDTLALRRAASCGDTNRLDLSIQSGADVNMADSFGNTALILAAQSGFDNCVNILIQTGADVNRRDRFGHTALMRAVKNSHGKCVDLLIKAGADVNVTDMYGYTTLIKATQICDENGNKFTHQLLQAGADVNVVNMYGDTALSMALAERNCSCVQTLIQAGADVNAAKDNGNTVLMAAVEAPDLLFGKDTRDKSKMRCFQLLLAAGAHVNKTNNKQQNALEYYVSRCEQVSPDIFMLLYAAGETIDSATTENIVWDQTNNNNCMGGLDDLTTNKSNEFCLKHISREAIRKHLFTLKPNEHLFCRIPELGLPPIITKYLLYDMSLEREVSVFTL